MTGRRSERKRIRERQKERGEVRGKERGRGREMRREREMNVKNVRRWGGGGGGWVVSHHGSKLWTYLPVNVHTHVETQRHICVWGGYGQ